MRGVTDEEHLKTICPIAGECLMCGRTSNPALGLVAIAIAVDRVLALARPLLPDQASTGVRGHKLQYVISGFQVPIYWQLIGFVSLSNVARSLTFSPRDE